MSNAVSNRRRTAEPSRTTIGKSVDRLSQILEGHKALFLHGHWHKSMLNDLNGMWVIGAGCSMNPKYTTGQQVNEYNVIKLTSEKITCVPYRWTEKQWKPDGKSFLNAGWKKVDSSSVRKAATPTSK